MSLLAASVLNLVQDLKDHSKGWRIEPFIFKGDKPFSGGLMIGLHPLDNHTSFTTFFVDNHHYDLQHAAIRINVKGETPRIISCLLVGDKLKLRYWAANGFRQNTPNFKYGTELDHDYASEVVYEITSIVRITRGRKNRGKKSPGKAPKLHIDAVEIGSPESGKKLAPIICKIIEASFNKNRSKDRSRDYGTRSAIVLDGKDFVP